MSVSSGNLTSLLNVSFPVEDFGGVAIQSYTVTAGFTSLPVLLSATVDTTGGPGPGTAEGVGETARIAAINNTTNTVTLVLSAEGMVVDQSTYYVLGYSADSLLLGLNSAAAVGLLLSDGINADDDVGVLSFDGVTPETEIAFTPDGTFTGAIPCFAKETRLMTPSGEKPVQQLRTGDLVMVAAGGSRPVRWIGTRTIDLSRHPDSVTVMPVRVRRDAFGTSRPHRDLLLSPDHAVFVDGVLIQIRQLINNASIVREPMAEITYYHVELDQHDIVLAEGLPTESYLDTDNRAAFANGGTPMMLHPEFADRSQCARAARGCAPLVTEAGQVEPVWRRLAERAAAIGFSVTPADDVTAEADLCLSAGGLILKPVNADGGKCVFAVPPLSGCARLVSRAAAPADVRPWLDDRRRLGVSVERIIFHRRDGRLEFPLEDQALSDGWHAPERDGLRKWRWTDGDALLPVPTDTMLLEIHIAGTAEYRVAANGPMDLCPESPQSPPAPRKSQYETVRAA